MGAPANAKRLADPVEVFAALCWSRAHRYATGELTLHEAVDWLRGRSTSI
jgi:hypothetical protein